MIHELPPAKGAPPLLVHVVRAGAGLVQVTLLDVVRGEVGYQLRLCLLELQSNSLEKKVGAGTHCRVSHLEEVELTTSDGVIPVDHCLRVVMVQVDVSGRSILEIIYLQ